MFDLVQAALMNSESSPNLGACIQEVFREELLLQTQNTPERMHQTSPKENWSNTTATNSESGID